VNAPVRQSNATALRRFLLVLGIVPPSRCVPMTSATLRGRPEIQPKNRQTGA
jgi:hypothetical protein